MLHNKRSNQPHVHFLTNIRQKSLADGSLDIVALTRFSDSISSTTVSHLASLHAKAYIADRHSAIITSANLTNSGLGSNLEYGVMFRDQICVDYLRRDFKAIAGLGNIIPHFSLEEIAELTQKRRQTARQQLSNPEDNELKILLAQVIEQSRESVLKARARGKTTNGILTGAILFLLERHGPLATPDLHPRIQSIHPDICDDTIDRVIGDVHFGKKWKHYVRNAQQGLKRRGQIEFLTDGRWSLVG